jgi:hypothetical protein
LSARQGGQGGSLEEEVWKVGKGRLGRVEAVTGESLTRFCTLPADRDATRARKVGRVWTQTAGTPRDLEDAPATGPAVTKGLGNVCLILDLLPDLPLRLIHCVRP